MTTPTAVTRSEIRFDLVVCLLKCLLVLFGIASPLGITGQPCQMEAVNQIRAAKIYISVKATRKDTGAVEDR